MHNTTSLPVNHYEMLGVPANATVDDISRAYKHRAVFVHPSGPPAAPNCSSEFQRLGLAYEVLSDPAKRRAYDRLGDHGVELVVRHDQQPCTAQHVFFFGARKLCWIASRSVVTTVAFGCAIALMAMVAARVDKVTNWSWPLVLCPLWLWDAYSLMIALRIRSTCCPSTAAVEFHPRPFLGVADFIPVGAATVGVILYIGSTCMLAVALGGSSLSASMVAAPAVLVELVVCAAAMRGCCDTVALKQRIIAVTGTVSPSTFVVGLMAINNVARLLEHLALFVLVAIRVDEYITVHYVVSCVPIFVSAIARFVVAVCWLRYRVRAGDLLRVHASISCVIEIVRAGLVVSGTVLVALKLQHNGAGPASLAVCLVPFFVFCGASFLHNGARCAFSEIESDAIDHRVVSPSDDTAAFTREPRSHAFISKDPNRSRNVGVVTL